MLLVYLIYSWVPYGQVYQQFARSIPRSMNLELEGISSDLLFLWHVMVSNKHLQTYHWNSPSGWENHPYFAIFLPFFFGH